MTGHEYAKLVAAYVCETYGERGIKGYREVKLGKSIIGKNRSIDLLLVHEPTQRALAIECKYQASQGTVDEKIPYAINDMEALWIPGCIVYAGDGFSKGVIHMLEASRLAAYCNPDAGSLKPSAETRELDHIIASVFRWWDIILGNKAAFDVGEWTPPTD